MRLFWTLFLLFTLFFGCSDKSTSQQNSGIVVTTFSLYDAARAVADGDIEVSMLIPFGVEVHDFEPTPKQIVRLKEAALFIYSGAGLEPWAEGFARKAAQQLDASGVAVVQKDSSGAIDPHYWLDFSNQIRVAEAIARRLSLLYPEKEPRFMQNFERYKSALQKLDSDFKARLQGCAQSTIFVNHNAYAYLGARYGFGIEAISALSPDAQPSPKRIEQIMQELKAQGARVIFYEEFENPQLVSSIAEDTGVDVKLLYPGANIDAEDAADGITFERLMRRNLESLVAALECHGV